MADLRGLYEKLVFQNIITYIQSGNVIFDSVLERPASEIEGEITQAIAQTFGFDVPVIVRGVEELELAITSNPYFVEDADIEKLFLTFLREEPSRDLIDGISNIDFSPDKFEIIGRCIFGFHSGKYHESKLTNNFFESKLKVSATTRNWKTVLKLLDLTRPE